MLLASRHNYETRIVEAVVAYKGLLADDEMGRPVMEADGTEMVGHYNQQLGVLKDRMGLEEVRKVAVVLALEDVEEGTPLELDVGPNSCSLRVAASLARLARSEEVEEAPLGRCRLYRELAGNNPHLLKELFLAKMGLTARRRHYLRLGRSSLRLEFAKARYEEARSCYMGLDG